MSNGAAGPNPAEFFTKAWTDMMSRMGASMGGQPAAAPPQAWPDEMTKQMQRTFFEAMAKYCDEYLRSPAFLGMMKQMMDQSIAFKQQVDRFITDAYRGGQATTQADLQDVASLLRGIEDRMMNRIDALERRMDDAEDHTLADGKGRTGKPAKKR